jgi:uncharacterized membrane-anchored protein YitT (DUF2179 family)
VSKRKTFIVEHLVILLGIILLNFGFYFFLLANNLVTGGVLGIATILAKFKIKTSYSMFAFNALFFIIGLIVLGKEYAAKTLFGTIVSPLIVFILEILDVSPNLIINQLTEAPILISAILGSVCIGVGLGFIFRNGGSTGGVDIIQNILNQKLHIDYVTAFFLTDGIIVLLGLIAFRNIELFLYSIGAVLLFSLIIDNLSIAGRAGHTLFIVTEKADEVKTAIFKKVDRGTTILNAKGGYSERDKKLVICVIHKKELNLTRHVIQNADPEAFTFIAQTKEAVGRGFSHE